MKIALDVSIQDTPWLTGVEKTQQALLRELAACDGKNEYVLLSRRPVQFSFPLPANFRFLDLEKQKAGYLWRERLLPPLLAKEGVDVYHSPVSAIPVAGNFGKIATVHEVPWLERNHAVEAARRVWLFLNVRYAKRIVAVSERTRANILRLYPDARGKVDVIHHGVDARFQPPAPGSSRTEVLSHLGVPDRPYLLFVGAPRKKKNIEGLVEAFAQLPKGMREELQLLLVGVRNPKECGLAAKVQALGLADSVRFPGYVADDDLVRLYQHAELFVFPSIFEGFGIPPLEAMACGTPVIASTGGALPEVVGDAALPVAPGDVQQLADAIRIVVASTKLRADLRRRGLERATQFTWRRATEKLLDLYRVVGEKAAGVTA